MSFIDSVKTCFGKYATFSGRAARSEFWWFMLFVIIGQVVLSYVDIVVFGPREIMMLTTESAMETGMSFNFSYTPQPITGIFLLATLLPTLAVSARRLHDGGRTVGGC